MRQEAIGSDAGDLEDEEDDHGGMDEALPITEESYQGPPAAGFDNSRGGHIAFFKNSAAVSSANAPMDFSSFNPISRLDGPGTLLPESNAAVDSDGSDVELADDDEDDDEEESSHLESTTAASRSPQRKRGRTDGGAMAVDVGVSDGRRPPKPMLRPHQVPFGKVSGEDRGPRAMDPPIYRTDPFYWLRDDDHCNEEVQSLLREEDSYCEKSLQHLQQLREKLYSEMMAHHKENDVDVPTAYSDGYAYYGRSFKGKSYRAHYRARIAPGTKVMDVGVEGIGSATGNPVPADVATLAAVAGFELRDEELLLDENDLREPGSGESPSFLSMHGPELSTDQVVMSHAVDFRGDDNYTIFFSSRPTVPAAFGAFDKEKLVRTDGSMIWDATGHAGLYYVKLDKEFRPFRVLHHQLGRPAAEDSVIFDEQDKRFSVSICKTRDERFLCVSSCSSETSEHHLLDMQCPSAGVVCVSPRSFGLRYSIDHRKGQLFIMTNKDGAKNEKLCHCPLTVLSGSLGSASQWHDFWRPPPQVKLESHSCFEHFLVVEAREGGVSRIYIMDYAGQEGSPDATPRHVVTYPETRVHDGTLLTPRTRLAASALFSVGMGDMHLCNLSTLRLWYSSYVVPSRIYNYHVPTRSFKLLKQEASPCYDPSLYRCERILSQQRAVPISLVYRADLHLEGLSGGPYPTLLTGYGAYGACQDPDFDRTLLSLLDRGVLYVVAHVRGGGELGREWYEDGRYLHVKNRFLDFHAVADTLISLGISEQQRLVAWGESSGGLLVAASINSRPDLFKAALLEVPFLDAMNTMSDPTIPLTSGEWEEIGNPNELETYHYMLEYSPYDNVRMQSYPALLLTASLNDSMVGYWEPLKFVSKLRRTKVDSHPVYLKVNFHAGHGHSSDKYEYLTERAHHFAFILEQLGLS